MQIESATRGKSFAHRGALQAPEMARRRNVDHGSGITDGVRNLGMEVGAAVMSIAARFIEQQPALRTHRHCHASGVAKPRSTQRRQRPPGGLQALGQQGLTAAPGRDLHQAEVVDFNYGHDCSPGRTSAA
jgi:hypothetical protein